MRQGVGILFHIWFSSTRWCITHYYFNFIALACLQCALMSEVIVKLEEKNLIHPL